MPKNIAAHTWIASDDEGNNTPYIVLATKENIALRTAMDSNLYEGDFEFYWSKTDGYAFITLKDAEYCLSYTNYNTLIVSCPVSKQWAQLALSREMLVHILVQDEEVRLELNEHTSLNSLQKLVGEYKIDVVVVCVEAQKQE